MTRKHLTIDGCSICQLRCAQCPATKMGYKNNIGRGYLTFENFVKVVSANPGLQCVEFDNYGELFLNKDLLKIMEYAYNHNIMLSCGGGVNFNDVSEDVLKSLTKYRFRYLNISIDGASQDTYGKYRIGGDFKTVIENIKKVNQMKWFYRVKYPILQWQFIVFGHNEHELPVARKMAEELGMRFYPKTNWNSDYSPIKDPEFVKRETGWEFTTREEYEEKYGINYNRAACLSLWNSPRLSWDMSLTGCCWNVWDRFTEDKMEFAKALLVGDYLVDKMPKDHTFPCQQCEIFIDIMRSASGHCIHGKHTHEYVLPEAPEFFGKLELLESRVKFIASNTTKYVLWRLGV